MLDLNDAYAIAKFIKDAEKQTPVKVYISTTAEIAKAENFKVFGNNGEYTLIGDYKTIMDANIPEDILVVMIKRNGDVFVPNGSTEILPGDILVLSGNKLKHFNEYREEKSTTLTEFSVEKKSSLINKSIKDADIPDDVLIVMIKRKGEVLVPNGNTIILPDDILVVTSNNMKEVEELLSV